jgi:hypothetical protein
MAQALLKPAAMVRALLLNVAACLLCLFGVGAGLVLLARFEDAGSASSAHIGEWPSESPVELAQDRDTLLMFAHPHCACAKCSLDELNRLVAKCPGKAAVHVFFLSPARYPSRWTLGGLWQSATSIPGAVVRGDVDGIVAGEFGAETSGSVLLYSPDGQLLFRGGITAESGCDPNKAAEESLLALLNGRQGSLSKTPVYGRRLLSEEDRMRTMVSN